MAVRESLTEYEKQYIREHAMTMSGAAIARAISRRGCDVTRFIKREGIPHISRDQVQYGGRKKDIDCSEEEFIKKIDETKELSLNDAAMICGVCTDTIVRYRKKYYGKSVFVKHSIVPKTKGTTWYTQEEADFVREHYNKMSYAEIGKAIGKTKPSVQHWVARHINHTEK